MGDIVEKNNDTDSDANSNTLISNTKMINTKLLYTDCENGWYTSPFYIYAPRNELDIDLFNQIINSKLLEKKNIEIEKKIKIPCFCESYILGNIYTGRDNYSVCSECKLILPFDLDFYSNKSQMEINNLNYADNDDVDNNEEKINDEYNLCKYCYSNDKIDLCKKQNLNLVKISTGLDNVSDWIKVFTLGGTSDFDEYYCNLNKNSPHYKKFALCSYVDMLGEEFTIIEKSGFEEIFA